MEKNGKTISTIGIFIFYRYLKNGLQQISVPKLQMYEVMRNVVQMTCLIWGKSAWLCIWRHAFFQSIVRVLLLGSVVGTSQTAHTAFCPIVSDKKLRGSIVSGRFIKWPSTLLLSLIWASYQISKIVGCAYASYAGNIFSTTGFKGNH